MDIYQLASQTLPALPAAVVIHVRGELDMRVSAQFKEDFNAAFTPQTLYCLIVLNEVKFIDSHNLGTFVGAYQRLKAKGGWVSVICTQPYVRRVFDIMNLDKLFRFYDDWDGFEAALKKDGLVDPAVAMPSLVENPPFATTPD